MLASLTSAPSVFSPRRDLPAAQARAGRVLNAMIKTGAVKPEQVIQAKAHPASITDRSSADARNYFLDTAADEARRLTNGATGDLTIATTMDPAMQDAGRRAVAGVLDKDGRARGASQGALVAMTTDGAVRAIIGGRDYADSSFNRVTQAHRQPGSSFKPMVYLTAIESGMTPWTTRNDEPITIKGWSPDNYEGEHRGEVTLKDALALSINTVAVALGQEVGIQSVVAVARRLGITSPLEPNASLALGTSEVTPIELTSVYADFASGGMKVEPYTVTEVRGAGGNVLYQRTPATPSRVIRDEDIQAMNTMMMGVVQYGTGRAADLPGRDVAGKTGTTQDWHDAWFVGYTADLVTGVWVGNDDSKPMKKVTGGVLPAQIWNRFMTVAVKNMPVKPLPQATQPALFSAADDQSGNFTDRRESWRDENTWPNERDRQQEDRRAVREDRHRGLLDWLFGSSDPEPEDDQGPPPRPLRDEDTRSYPDYRR